MKLQNATFDGLLNSGREAVVAEWLTEFATGGRPSKGTAGQQLTTDARAVLDAMAAGIENEGDPAQFGQDAWASLRDVLDGLSASRAAQGVSSEETSRFVLCAKKPLFERLQLQTTDGVTLMEAVLWLSRLVDRAAQHTVGAFQRSREEIINRQQEELLELSTPVVKLWEGVLAVPMIGTLDSSRTQMVMEALLQRIVDSGSALAIIDITGVPTVDTLVAQHLLKTVTAIRLMGADCIISGIRPQIAQTIVHLGIDLQGIVTKATLADALALALRQTGYVVSRAKV